MRAVKQFICFIFSLILLNFGIVFIKAESEQKRLGYRLCADSGKKAKKALKNFFFIIIFFNKDHQVIMLEIKLICVNGNFRKDSFSHNFLWPFSFCDIISQF